MKAMMVTTENNAGKHISFEVFPPKKEGDFASAYQVVSDLASLKPEFISVTYGAGGSMSKKTIDIASFIQNELKVQAIAHMTCVGSTRADIDRLCVELENNNITNVLALRGDRPKDMSDAQFQNREFIYAADLIAQLKKKTGLRILGACYPEKHFEAASMEADLIHMKEKQDIGVEAFITQLFFDNRLFYQFRERAEKIGIKVPIHAGIMPVTSAKQISTSISLSGSSVPKKLTDIIANYGNSPQDMYQAGIDYAIEQIVDLQKNGVDGIHIYTMNKPDIAKKIVESC